MTATLSYSGSSVLSTPVLSSLSSSSTSSSNDSSSFYSVLYTDDLRSIDVGDSLTASTFGSSSNSPSGHTSPFISNPPTEAKAASACWLASVKNIASSVNGTMFGTSFEEQRRLDRRKPTPLPLVDPFDEMLTLPQDESFIESMSSTNVSVISRGRSSEIFAGSWVNMVPTIKRTRTSGASFGRNFAQKDDLSDSRSIRRIRSWGRLISFIRARSWSMSRRDDNALITRNEVKVNLSGKTDISKIHIHSIRELAILPTQRVMRYTLLFQELVTYTPASPSQERVQMAHEGALLLAQKCDKAQENLAFLHGSR